MTKQILKEHLYENESNERIISETTKLRLSEVTYQSFGEKLQMYRLEIKIKDQYIFIRRYTKRTCLPPYNYEADTLRKHINMIDPEKGYYSVYGNPRDEYTGNVYGEGNPEYELEFAKQYKFRDITSIDKIGNGIYKFWGNYENYSATFNYIIWDENLAEKIKLLIPKLKKESKN